VGGDLCIEPDPEAWRWGSLASALHHTVPADLIPARGLRYFVIAWAWPVEIYFEGLGEGCLKKGRVRRGYRV